jgi:hypothetical protein
MKKKPISVHLAWFATGFCVTAVILAMVVNGMGCDSGGAAAQAPPIIQGDYTVVGWNNLGMHCINPNFQTLCVLPPYNTMMVQVIRRGDPPQVVTSGVELEYSIVNNTTVTGKTDFWQHAQSLFGANLAPGVGLAGYGLSGTMALNGDHYEAVGIPVLPLDDQMKWNPYQTAVVRLKTADGKYVATSSVTLPVSDELRCDKCHGPGGDAGGYTSPVIEINILRSHDAHNATQLEAQAVQQNTPVLCAQCHSDNALGMAGTAGVKSLSEAMHGWHSGISSDQPACYDCHPGANTQCNRTAIDPMGRVSLTDPGCERCHGDLATVAASITAGRAPWVNEPACAQCHGTNHDTAGVLYRNAKGGHGGLYCCTCHNSPHAYWPSRMSQDNTQPMAYQGTPNAIRNCSACHTQPQSGDNPHETIAPIGP